MLIVMNSETFMTLQKQAAAVAGATAMAAALVGMSSAAQANTDLPAAIERIAVQDDPLEPTIVLTTEAVDKSTRGVLRTRHNDHYLRAIVDRQSGAVRYELRQTLQYVGNFRDFQHAHYQSGQGVAVTPLTRIDENEAHCNAVDPQAACTEVVTFTVPETALRGAATAGGEPWAFKFKPRLGDEHRAAMSRTEIQALLSAVDTFKAQRFAALTQP